MRISTRLRLAALIPVLMALFTVSSLLVSYRSISRLREEQSTLIQISAGLGELNDLARSYVLNHDERSQRQFQLQHERITSLTSKAAATGRYVPQLALIEKDNQLVESLFGKLVDNYARETAGGDGAFLREAEDRLAGQLFIRSRHANLQATALVQQISDDILVLERRVVTVIGLASGLAAAVLTVGLLVLVNRITRPLGELTAGTERVGSGDLLHRIEVTTSDELGMLASSFNRMTERLRTVTVSRDELEREVEVRKRAERSATILREAAATAGTSLDLQVLSRRVLARLRELMGLKSAAVYRLDARGVLRNVAIAGAAESKRELFDEVEVNEGSLSGQVVLHDEVRSYDGESLPERSRWRAESTELLPATWIGVPIHLQSQVIGVLTMVFPSGTSFDAEDLSLFEGIADTLGIAMENARLYEVEHDISDRLQSALLSLPDSIAGIEFARSYHSATERARVGGDFYDLFEIEHGLIAIVIGDVAGKGLDAAVLTSLVKNTVRAHTNERGRRPEKVMALTNDVVYRATPSESFVTVFLGVLDCEDWTLTYVNAGHTTAALVSDSGIVRSLPSTGPLVGAFPDLTFGQDEICCLGNGEVLLLYTDGLTEAGHGRDRYGEGRLFELLSRVREASPQGLVRQVVDDVMLFTSGQLGDDLAILALKRTGGRCGEEAEPGRAGGEA